MARRKETTTTTVTREKRIEFSAADLRRRLRLPEDAQLALSVGDGGAGKVWTVPDESDALVATFTRTSKPREGSA